MQKSQPECGEFVGLAIALLRLSRVLVRQELACRGHRRITDQKVNASLEEWIERTGFVDSVRRDLSLLARDGEQDLGKPIDTWSVEELARHQRIQVKYFDRLRERTVRGKGRPKKRGRGLIAGAMSIEAMRTWSRTRRKESISAFVKQVVAAKKKLYASIGGFKTLANLERAIILNPQLQSDLDKDVADALAVREALEQLGLPVTQKSINKHKMLYSRKKKR